MNSVSPEISQSHTPTARFIPEINNLVLSSKLIPPRVSPGQIERRSLRDRLAAWCTHRLTMITAPAGYGKSTLASQLIQDIELQSTAPFSLAWLTLDSEDDEPSRFLTCFAAALSTFIPDSTEGLNWLPHY